ncbi:hypothetical protein M426DRAFT_265881 [Hypoxylon sp. CI-4A]|nr:hypothetical protein M426DRAFT_265881 [Hypoxylon sp. CI-4A]
MGIFRFLRRLQESEKEERRPLPIRRVPEIQHPHRPHSEHEHRPHAKHEHRPHSEHGHRRRSEHGHRSSGHEHRSSRRRESRRYQHEGPLTSHPPFGEPSRIDEEPAIVAEAERSREDREETRDDSRRHRHRCHRRHRTNLCGNCAQYLDNSHRHSKLEDYLPQNGGPKPSKIPVPILRQPQVKVPGQEDTSRPKKTKSVMYTDGKFPGYIMPDVGRRGTVAIGNEVPHVKVPEVSPPAATKRGIPLRWEDLASSSKDKERLARKSSTIAHHGSMEFSEWI